jgi:hypothetical protein
MLIKKLHVPDGIKLESSKLEGTAIFLPVWSDASVDVVFVERGIRGGGRGWDVETEISGEDWAWHTREKNVGTAASSVEVI